MVEPRAFWNKKILRWEAGRYDWRGQNRNSILERIADRSSISLRHRQRLGVELISENIAGRHIVELGCGSGLLAMPLLEAGAATYHGMDISNVAIEAALARSAGYDQQERISFEIAQVSALPKLHPGAVIISLGLLDWLNDDELANLVTQQGNRDYLHSISESRASLSQLLHRTYVQIAYGYRTGQYVPRYFKTEDIAGLFTQQNKRPAYVYRDAALSFGALVSSFPVGSLVDTSVG
jgi:2-polyprenyl-3-methyl-5-hydroxy-6-metoxy-1,4-benzoquinol methylase